MVSAIAALLVGFGYLTPEEAAAANVVVTDLVEQIGALVFTLTSFIALFAKDGDKTSEEVGLPFK